MPRYLLLIIVPLLLCACAEGPDGVITVNRETIEDYFEGEQKSWSPPSDLDLELTQKIEAASLPPLPEGQIRISGVLDSVGPYRTDAPQKNPFPGSEMRGSVFTHSVFGMLGPAGGAGNAWFYADLDPETGNVLAARAYLYGFMGGVCDMRRDAKAFYDLTSPGSFTLSLAGPCLFPEVTGSTSEFALLIQAKINPLKAKPNKRFPVRYIVDSNGDFDAIPQNPANWWAVLDYGGGYAHTEK